MKYKELLALYRSGQLAEEQRRQVEADIDRHDAITEYLYQESEIPSLEALPMGAEQPYTDEDDALSREIHKTIHRAFVKLGVTVGAAVLVVTLCVIFVLPRLVDVFYYRPDAPASDPVDQLSVPTNQMSLDFSVWSELFLPGRYRNNVMAEPRGYGVYDISIVQNASADGRFDTVNGQLERNKLKLYDSSYFRLPVGNAFLLPEDKSSSYSSYCVDGETGEKIPVDLEEQRQLSFQRLRDRPTNDLLIACLSLDEIMDYDRFTAWYESLPLEPLDVWAGIYAEDGYGQWATQNTGLILTPSGSFLEWDRSRYPHLSLLGEGIVDEERNEALYQAHFLDMLRYLEDHPRLPELFGHGYTDLDPQAARAYVEENGLELYGLAVVASRDELLKLEDDPRVSCISITPY